MDSLKKNLPKNLLSFIFVLLLAGFLGKRILKADHYQRSYLPKNGIITAVYDGDTIKVKFPDGRNRRVRLIGIDTPELNDSREKIRFKAYMAKRFTFFHLYRQRVKISYDWQLEDKYGRLLAYIWSEKEGLFNKFILQEGFASAFLYFPFRKDYKKEFLEAEREARKVGKGIWQKGAYPSISVDEAHDYIGRIVSLVYNCHRLNATQKFFFLGSAKNRFSALIYRENISNFPQVESLKGKTLSVTGFLEKYRGQPQIMIFLPMQIEVKEMFYRFVLYSLYCRFDLVYKALC